MVWIKSLFFSFIFNLSFLIMEDNQSEMHRKSDNQRGDKSQRGSGGGLCLTLPSNFSPCSGGGGQRGSVGSCGSGSGGGSVSPGREKGSRGEFGWLV